MATQLFELMRADPNQLRKECVWHPVLAAVAQAHCLDMLERNYFAHVDPDGHGPNWRVLQAGYKLSYGSGADNQDNEIESIGINYLTPELEWDAWLVSPHHHDHVLGVGFFAAQTNVGIGFVASEKIYPRYFCLCSAPPEAS